MHGLAGRSRVWPSNPCSYALPLPVHPCMEHAHVHLMHRLLLTPGHMWSHLAWHHDTQCVCTKAEHLWPPTEPPAPCPLLCPPPSGAVDPPRDTKDHYPALYDALQTIDARNLRQARMALAAAQAQLARLMGHAARPPPPVTPAAEPGAAVQPAGAPAHVHEPGLEATGEAAGEEAAGGGPAVAAVIGIHAAVPGAEGGSQAPQPPLPAHTHHSPIASTLPSPPLPHMTAELLGVTVRRHTASRLPALCALRCLTSLTLFGKSAAAQPHGHRLASHLSALAGLPQLRRLELWSYEDISDVELAPLAACTRLEHLYVDSLFIKQAVGPVFPSLTSLTMARIKFILRPLTAIFPSLDRLRLGVLQRYEARLEAQAAGPAAGPAWC
ncbi:hypothetical protein V8C86DRAFT_117341 [Haematococcus lacustris]